MSNAINDVISFEKLNLNLKIIKALNQCGHTTPTPVQQQAIPQVLQGNDIVASAQTGTGKTAAFLLPVLERLANNNQPQANPRILILTPTRELADQITEAVYLYGQFLNVRVVTLVGGVSYYNQIKKLERSVDIVVATPGRLFDHVRRGHLNLSQIEMWVLDEADRMLDMGFIEDVKKIAKMISTKRQTLLFSATISPELDHIIKNLLRNPVSIKMSETKISPANITHQLYMTDHIRHKKKLLEALLKDQEIKKAIIFTETKFNVDQLTNELHENGFRVLPLHGDLKQNHRNNTVDQFRRGKIRFIVATNVAARGLHIDDVSHVINFDLPRASEDYIHRIGRTGRAGKSGTALSFASFEEMAIIKRIESHLGMILSRVTIAGLEPTKQIAKRPDDNKTRRRPFNAKGRKRSNFNNRRGSKDRRSRES